MERRALLSGLAAFGAMALVGCSRSDDDPEPAPSSSGTTTEAPAASPEPSAAGTPTIAATIATGLNVPWGMAFLANGDALVSQRDEGTVVRIATDGTVTSLGEVPGSSGRPGGEGGLLGIATPPGDESVLFAYVTTGSDDRIVRMSMSGDSLGEPQEILTGIPIGSRHHGGRLLFDPTGGLFVSTGDAGNGELAQDRDSLAGKVLRIDQDGRAAAGNPFGNRTWSYGHRNIEALAFDADGRLWAAEFGDKSADELNLIERGGNYGWPDVEGRSDDGDFVNPKVTWGTDECSPAGLAITKSTAYVGALQGECLYSVPLDGTSTGKPKAWFAGDHGRIRSVAVAPDGALWVATSNTDGRGDPAKGDDRILRVTV
ncbi:PQQ-dependent sugar dehydrogenase [Aeromicrobium wangtongii]|uniref:PQQ-dependent sugar dehydrogenase n=1 Tax=Aeromicrobium wangtongii TaxID=2969247 RepID=UPI0020173836|nr:PQQ-dependent sugar dehydrogenase [Aeromicrobium wangtongii]MCL3819008.1 PQQ-dependent sugar dehydrogenase [Aeromicrobium wangtongii]